jgi:hypothetical protein
MGKKPISDTLLMRKNRAIDTKFLTSSKMSLIKKNETSRTISPWKVPDKKGFLMSRRLIKKPFIYSQKHSDSLSFIIHFETTKSLLKFQNE